LLPPPDRGVPLWVELEVCCGVDAEDGDEDTCVVWEELVLDGKEATLLWLDVAPVLVLDVALLLLAETWAGFFGGAGLGLRAGIVPAAPTAVT
jgi:hypothetical protein